MDKEILDIFRDAQERKGNKLGRGYNKIQFDQEQDDKGYWRRKQKREAREFGFNEYYLDNL